MIVDYASLQQGVADWLARADLTNQISTFIQLAEARINRELFVRQRQAEVTGTSSAGVIPLPADLYRIQSLKITVGGVKHPLSPKPADYDCGVNIIPIGYYITDDEIRLIGTQDQSYTLTYWAKVPTLNDAAPQNWLLLAEPGIYLYGTLVETAPYLKADARLGTWAGLYSAIVAGMTVNDDYARFGVAPAQVVMHAP